MMRREEQADMTATDTTRQELLDASDEQIEDAVTYADPMVLRGLLYQLTADEEVRTTKVEAVVFGFGQAPMVTSKEEVEMLRRKAADFLRAYRDSGAGWIDPGPEKRLPTSLSLAVGEEIDDPDSLARSVEELGLDPFARNLKWRHAPDPGRLGGFSVTVIGAGLVGLTASLMLKAAGIPYTVIEKNSEVGGTWYENRYPGARVDTPSRGYTNIFGVDFPYPNPFCGWTENRKYFNWVADTYDLRGNIVFDTEVRSLRWDDASATWEIEVDGAEGKRTLRSNAVITAVGFLNRRNIPEIEGMEDFAGPSWHTSRWPEDFDVTGKRIAVIGTGATGYQTVPELALQADHVAVFQRTPSWVFAMPGYRSPFPPQVNWLDRNFPYHTNFMRHRTAYRATAFAKVTRIDPDFHDPYAASAANKALRDSSIAFLNRKLGDPGLVAKMTPEYPVFGARPVIVDAEYSILDAIIRDNVTLVTDGIRRITEAGIEANDGTKYEFDAIVYATGFYATEYLYPMTISGRNGRTIESYWEEGGARAYRFSMVPGFPNLWSLYGPNTNGGLSPAAFHELVTGYALQCMQELILHGKRSIEPTEEAYWKFARDIDERNSKRVWSDPRVHSYYWSRHGRSPVMNPIDGPEAWRILRYPDFGDLEIR
jgi:4-hydroxyacetophenone monooxygenase